MDEDIRFIHWKFNQDILELHHVIIDSGSKSSKDRDSLSAHGR